MKMYECGGSLTTIDLASISPYKYDAATEQEYPGFSPTRRRFYKGGASHHDSQHPCVPMPAGFCNRVLSNPG